MRLNQRVEPRNLYVSLEIAPAACERLRAVRRISDDDSRGTRTDLFATRLETISFELFPNNRIRAVVGGGGGNVEGKREISTTAII